MATYDKHLLRNYRAHINVEVWSSVKSVKFLFKYIYKGHDSALMEIRHNLEDNNAQNNAYERDEVREYLSCRCVSPPEAF